MKLLYRADKYDDESFSDFLDRLGCWNGFSSKETFSRCLADLFNETYGGDKNKKVDEHKVHLMLEQLLGRNIPEAGAFSMALSKIPSGTVKVCANCWKENRYIRFYWRFNSYVECHVHGVLLTYPNLFSYQSDNSVGEQADNSLDISEKYPRHLLVEAIKFYLGSDCSLSLIEEDLEQHRYAKEITEWVAGFFSEKLGVILNLTGALKVIDSGNLIGLSVPKKMESIYARLLSGNELLETNVRIITAIRIGDQSTFWTHHRRYEPPALGFEQWRKTEVLSIDDLFYAYLGFGQRNGTPKNYKIRYEMTGFDNLDPHVDRQLCLAIFSGSIRWPYGRDEDLAKYQFKLQYAEAKPRSIKYHEFLKMLGYKTVDDLDAVDM